MVCYRILVNTQGTGSGGVPIGSVIAWPLADDPAGPDAGKWIECDGRVVDASRYPKLAALMSFVPDYRGVFLRGYGSVSSSHFSMVEHQSAALGIFQGDSIRNAYGTFEAVSTAGQGLSGIFTATGRYGTSTFSGTNRGQIIELNFKNGFPVSNEIRPVNRSVRWMIRAA